MSKQPIGPLGPYHDAFAAAHKAKTVAKDASIPLGTRRFQVMDLCTRAVDIMYEYPGRFRGAEASGIRVWIGEAQEAVGLQ